MSYEPGTYVKGDSERVAKNAREAVALEFDGYRRKAESAPVEEPSVEEQPVVVEEPVSETPKVEAPKPGPRKPIEKKD